MQAFAAAGRPFGLSRPWADKKTVNPVAVAWYSDEIPLTSVCSAPTIPVTYAGVAVKLQPRVSTRRASPAGSPSHASTESPSSQMMLRGWPSADESVTMRRVRHAVDPAAVVPAQTLPTIVTAGGGPTICAAAKPRFSLSRSASSQVSPSPVVLIRALPLGSAHEKPVASASFTVGADYVQRTGPVHQRNQPAWGDNEATNRVPRSEWYTRPPKS